MREKGQREREKKEEKKKRKKTKQHSMSYYAISIHIGPLSARQESCRDENCPIYTEVKNRRVKFCSDFKQLIKCLPTSCKTFKGARTCCRTTVVWTFTRDIVTSGQGYFSLAFAQMSLNCHRICAYYLCLIIDPFTSEV